MESYKDLVAQIEALKQKAEEMRKAELAAVITDIKLKMKEYGLTATDLGGFSSLARKAKSTVAAKYRNPATGEEWTGRGRAPNWLTAEMAKGKTKDDFLI